MLPIKMLCLKKTHIKYVLLKINKKVYIEYL